MGKNFQLACALSCLITLPSCSDDSSSPSDGSSGAGTGGTGQSGAGPSGAGQGGSSSNAGRGGGGAGSSGGSGNSGSATGGSTTGVPGKPGEVGGCKIFPAQDHWNLDVSGVAVDATWTKKVQDLVGNARIHPDYGVDGEDLYGIPLNVVPESQPLAPVTFDWYPEESDEGPYPFPGPDDVIIEGNSPESCDGDCHLLVIQQGTCMLFEG